VYWSGRVSKEILRRNGLTAMECPEYNYILRNNEERLEDTTSD